MENIVKMLAVSSVLAVPELDGTKRLAAANLLTRTPDIKTPTDPLEA
jgi:hypothetical protein